MKNSLEIAKKYFDLSNNRKLEQVLSLLYKNIIYSSDNTGLYIGKIEVIKMIKTFFSKFPFLNWKIDSIELIKDSIVEIYFTLKMTDENGLSIEKKGVERIIVNDGLISYIEVRNIKS